MLVGEKSVKRAWKLLGGAGWVNSFGECCDKKC